jgi:signal transduction histidine kinase
LAGVANTNTTTQVEGVIQDVGRELEALREELAKYRSIFDSARLVVGHELTRPLTSISGYVELLESELDHSLGEKERRYCHKIKEAVDRLENIIESFVQMLRFDTDTTSGDEVEMVNIHNLVERVRSRFGDHASRIENAVDSGLGAVRLRRSIDIVIENLVSNAIKHSGSTEPVLVTASIRRERRGTSDRRLLIMSIEDRGAGIPEDRIKDVFDPFCRLGDSRGAGNLGLGLALVKSIIAIMDGEIHIKSEPGNGTCVTFTIPVADGSGMRPDRIG